MLQKKLNDMNSMMKAKEEKLRGRFRDTHTALQWLRQNRQLFKGNVYEPMMLVVSDAVARSRFPPVVGRGLAPGLNDDGK